MSVTKSFSRLLTLAAVLFAVPAFAHLDLQSPTSRYGRNALKEGPCGLPGGQRTTKVTELVAGAPLEVVWDEYVNHPGHFRISFDIDGDDDFADPLCLSGCNTRSPQIARYSNAAVLLDGIADTPSGGIGRVTVTLPDVECDRCTLQVIQVMYDKPPYELGGDDIYYQCADLVLRRPVAFTPTPSPTLAPTESPTFVPSDLPTPVPTRTATSCVASATISCGAACPGDCNHSDDVDVSELVTLVRIALGDADISTCRAGDPLGHGEVQITDIVAAVQRSLNGCTQI